MRVVAGDFKGRHIEPVPGNNTRPTAQRVREAISSSIISNLDCGIENAKALDAFAGSGALGIEMLSRGALSCTFVELDPKAARIVEQNISNLPLQDGQAKLLRADMFELAGDTTTQVASSAILGGSFNLVLIDPPYAVEPIQVAKMISALNYASVLEDGALIVYEMATRKTPGYNRKRNKKEIPLEVVKMQDILQDTFELIGVKHYGITQVVYFKKLG